MTIIHRVLADAGRRVVCLYGTWRSHRACEELGRRYDAFEKAARLHLEATGAWPRAGWFSSPHQFQDYVDSRLSNHDVAEVDRELRAQILDMYRQALGAANRTIEREHIPPYVRFHEKHGRMLFKLGQFPSAIQQDVRDALSEAVSAYESSESEYKSARLRERAWQSTTEQLDKALRTLMKIERELDAELKHARSVLGQRRNGRLAIVRAVAAILAAFSVLQGDPGPDPSTEATPHELSQPDTPAATSSSSSHSDGAERPAG